MFTNREGVRDITGFEVENEEIRIAQAIIEGLVGRIEERVDNAIDHEILAKATAYQAVYMHENPDSVFTQIALRNLRENDYQVAFLEDGTSPFIAPLARLLVRNLSWMRTRSITVEPHHTTKRGVAWETI